MPSPELLARIAAAKLAVLAQTERLHAELGRAASHWKSDGTRVTPVDIAISENIFRMLGTEFPADNYFSEELAETDQPRPVTARFAWVLDPIDGTNNYAAGIPYCAIGLGLLEDGMPVYGFVYDLARRRLIHGGPGIGLWDGDEPAQMRTAPLHRHSLIGFHTPFDKVYAPHAVLIAEHHKIRGLGSSTLHLAYVAAGILEGVVDHNVRVWDIAGAVPLVEAAGGAVQFLNGAVFPLKEFDLKMRRIFYVAGSPGACRQLRTMLGV